MVNLLRILTTAAGLWVAAECFASAAPQPTSGHAPISPQVQFWTKLRTLCGQAYAGRVVENHPADPSIDGEPLIMDVLLCADTEIRIGFTVGENRSRTWVFTKTFEGLRLKHDHRHEDGTEDEITQYGGDTKDPGTATSQSFHADAYTASLIPAASTNVWTVELSDDAFVYSLTRVGTDRTFRAEFDLAEPVSTPLPPWGSDPTLPFFMPTPDGWRTETIPFPLGFAPELDYEGLEELRFSPGMFDAESEEYWTYAFVWWIDVDSAVDAATLSQDLEDYFRGLAHAVLESEDFELGDVNFEATIREADGRQFGGVANALDAFVTRKPVVLNVSGDRWLCKKEDRLVVWFALSPQPTNHAVWSQLDEIRQGFHCSADQGH